MHTSILIGVLISMCGASIGLAAFFIRTWIRRRTDGEFLLFGLLTLCLAAYNALVALGYYQAIEPAAGVSVRFLLDGLALTSKLALALLLHFALRYGRVRRPWRFFAPAYVLTGIFSVMILTGQWWAEVPSSFSFHRVMGLELPQLHVRVNPPAYLFYVMVVVVLVAVVGLLGRPLLRGRREGVLAFVGSMVLVVTVLNDAALGTGLYPTIPLISAGYLALALGLSFTLVTRYGAVAAELEERSGQLSASLEELQSSYEQLERTQEELVKSEQLAVVGELAAVIAHEVRNPLAVVSNAVASLRKGESAATDPAVLLEIIQEEVGRLDRLVGQLLNYARPIVPSRAPVDLKELLTRSMTVAGEHHGIRLELDVESGVSQVAADPDLLRQAFDNIIANGIQALGDEGNLDVRARSRTVDGEPSVVISFIDDGPGMSEEVREQARAPFFTTRSTGTGLGLSIVERIVAAHEGTVDIDSEPGGGTTIAVVLPTSGGRLSREPGAPDSLPSA